MKKIAVVALLFLLVGCDFILYDRYKVTNNSDDTICVYLATGYYNFGPTAYPDTMLPKHYLLDVEWYDGSIHNVGIDEFIDSAYVPPHEMRGVTPILMCEEDGEIPPRPPHDILSVFIISKDTLKKYPYDDIRRNNRILARYDLSWDRVKSLDHNIPYPLLGNELQK